MILNAFKMLNFNVVLPQYTGMQHSHQNVLFPVDATFQSILSTFLSRRLSLQPPPAPSSSLQPTEDFPFTFCISCCNSHVLLFHPAAAWHRRGPPNKQKKPIEKVLAYLDPGRERKGSVWGQSRDVTAHPSHRCPGPPLVSSYCGKIIPCTSNSRS